jgi:hypothetical protein
MFLNYDDISEKIDEKRKTMKKIEIKILNKKLPNRE